MACVQKDGPLYDIAVRSIYRSLQHVKATSLCLERYMRTRIFMAVCSLISLQLVCFVKNVAVRYVCTVQAVTVCLGGYEDREQRRNRKESNRKLYSQLGRGGNMRNQRSIFLLL